MNLVVDGIIFTMQARGGISRLYHEILPRICNLDPHLNLTLLLQDKPLQTLPEHRQIRPLKCPGLSLGLQKIFPALAERIHKKYISKALAPFRAGLWHSTYFTLPPQSQWGGPVIVTVHDVAYEKFPDCYSGAVYDRFREQVLRCIRRADAVICVSEATRQEVIRLYRPDEKRLYVVHNGLGTDFRVLETRQTTPPEQSAFLLYVGKRGNYKNFSLLARAFSQSKIRTNMNILAVGPQLNPEEHQYFEQLGIHNKIHILSDVDDRRLCELYNQAAAFVYPSLHEGFGIPLLEAMASGCPVLASDIPSSREVAGDIPYYFDPDNGASLIQLLNNVKDLKKDTNRIERGLEHAQTYSWERTAAETLAVFKQYANSR